MTKEANIYTNPSARKVHAIIHENGRVVAEKTFEQIFDISFDEIYKRAERYARTFNVSQISCIQED